MWFWVLYLKKMVIWPYSLLVLDLEVIFQLKPRLFVWSFNFLLFLQLSTIFIVGLNETILSILFRSRDVLFVELRGRNHPLLQIVWFHEKQSYIVFYLVIFLHLFEPSSCLVNEQGSVLFNHFDDLWLGFLYFDLILRILLLFHDHLLNFWLWFMHLFNPSWLGLLLSLMLHSANLSRCKDASDVIPDIIMVLGSSFSQFSEVCGCGDDAHL